MWGDLIVGQLLGGGNSVRQWLRVTDSGVNGWVEAIVRGNGGGDG